MTGNPGVTRQATALAALGVVALVAGGVLQPVRFLSAYLFAYLFWLGLSLGALSLHMIGHVAGGRWAQVTAAPFLAAAGVLPVMLLLFFPLAFGMRALYPWMGGDAMPGTLLVHKATYLNADFFLLRAALYFSVWLTLAGLLAQRSRPDLAPEGARAVQRLSALGLVLYGVTGSFAMIDWVMSLVPGWYSTVFAAEVLAAQLLQGAALGVWVVAAAARGRADEAAGGQLHDLGNLMLAFTLLWAYLAYSEFVTIWIADLPAETLWYRLRLQPPWAWMGPALILLLFAIPFSALLFRRLKMHPQAVGAVALVVLAGALLNAYWLVVPSLRTGLTGMHWLDALAPLAMGAVWIGVFQLQLHRPSGAVARWRQT